MAKTTTTPVRSSRPTPRQAPGRPIPARAKKNEGVKAMRPFEMPFDAKNYRILAIGIVVIVVGYLVMYFSPTMSDMALTVSPILLLLGYCVIVPIGILAGVRKKRMDVSAMPEPATNGAAHSA